MNENNKGLVTFINQSQVTVFDIYLGSQLNGLLYLWKWLTCYS